MRLQPRLTLAWSNTAPTFTLYHPTSLLLHQSPPLYHSTLTTLPYHSPTATLSHFRSILQHSLNHSTNSTTLLHCVPHPQAPPTPPYCLSPTFPVLLPSQSGKQWSFHDGVSISRPRGPRPSPHFSTPLGLAPVFVRVVSFVHIVVAMHAVRQTLTLA